MSYILRFQPRKWSICLSLLIIYGSVGGSLVDISDSILEMAGVKNIFHIISNLSLVFL